MDIASVASAISNATVQNKVDVAVAKKTLDVQKEQGQAIVQMLDAAKDVGKSTAGSVNGLDLYA
jgi:hypothetical protein